MVSGTLFDGRSAVDAPVKVAPAADGLLVSPIDGGASETVPTALLRIDSDRSDKLRIGRSDREGWALILGKPLDPAIEGVLPRGERYGRLIDRVGIVPALAIAGVLTASILTVGYLAPHWIAPHVPVAWEQEVGRSITGDLAGVRCNNPDGQKALEALVERIEPGATREGPGQIRISAINLPMMNAAALPGGQIVVFKGAFSEVEADALAGIVAHEVAHVRRRHVMEGLLRELGVGALVGMFGGQWAASLGDVMSLSYSRSAEAEADRDAIAALKRAGIDPRPTAALFDKVAKEEGHGLATEWLTSHPASEGRARTFAASYDKRATYRPALSQQRYDELWNVCWKGPGS